MLSASPMVWAQQTTGPQNTAPQQNPAPVFNSPSNIKARDVIGRAIAALGGQRYLTYKYKSGSGRAYTFSSTGELDNPGVLFWSFSRFPDAERIELTKERDVVYVYNGDKGWQISFRGIQPAKPQQLRERLDAVAHSIDVVLRHWVPDPQTLMLYKGISMSDEKQVEEVDLFNKDGEAVVIFFDINSHLPVAEKWKRQDPDTGDTLEESSTFGNYQTFNGINTPLELQRFEGEQRLSQRFYETVSYAPVPDNLFEPTTKSSKK